MVAHTARQHGGHPIERGRDRAHPPGGIIGVAHLPPGGVREGAHLVGRGVVIAGPMTKGNPSNKPKRWVSFLNPAYVYFFPCLNPYLGAYGAMPTLLGLLFHV